MTIGRMETTDNVMNRGQSTLNWPFARNTSSTTVPFILEFRKMLGAMKSFHIHMVLKMMDVAVMGFIRGNTMRKNTPPTLQPSTMAASVSSLGMVRI